jgi:Na+-driven multidrug efflux pump
VFVISSLVIVFLSETIGLWFLYNKMVIPPERLQVSFWVLQFSILSVPFVLTQVPYSAILIAHENMKVYAYMSIADAVVRLVIVYALFVSPFDKLMSLTIMSFIWSIVSMTVYRIYCVRMYPESRICFCFDWPLYKRIVSYAGSDMIGQLSCLAQGQGFNLLLNTFFGPVVNAARGIAYGLQGMMMQFASNFMVAVRPQITTSYAQGDYEGMWSLVRRSSCLSYYLVLVLALPAWIEGDFILKLWLGDYPDHTLSFFHLMVISCLIDTLRKPLVGVFHATGRIFRMNMIVGVVLCMAFPIAYLCLRNGCRPECVFLCTIGSFSLAAILEWILLRSILSYNIFFYIIQVYGRCTLVTMISSMILFNVATKYLEEGFCRLVLTGITSIVIVALTVLCVGVSSSDRSKVLTILRCKVGKIFSH